MLPVAAQLIVSEGLDGDLSNLVFKDHLRTQTANVTFNNHAHSKVKHFIDIRNRLRDIACRLVQIYWAWPLLVISVYAASRRLVIGRHTGAGRHPQDRKSTRLNSSHSGESRMPSSA